jgi:hypothetical protein
MGFPMMSATAFPSKRVEAYLAGITAVIFMVSVDFPGKGLSHHAAGHESGYLKNEGCVKDGNSAWQRRAGISAATPGVAAPDSISHCHGIAPLLKSGAYPASKDA